MLRFRRYREFVALTLLVGFLLYLNLFQGAGNAPSSKPKPFDFVHEAKEVKQAKPDPGPRQGLVRNRPAPPRPLGGSNDPPKKPLNLDDIALDLGPVITDNPPTPPKKTALQLDEAPLDDSSRTDRTDNAKPQKQAADGARKLPSDGDANEADSAELSIQTADASPPGGRPPLIRPERFPVTSTRALPLGTPLNLPRIQFDFSDVQESQDGKADRLEKLNTIKDATIQTWRHYRKQAWLHDEVKPESGGWRDPFGGLAATLVDSLDTLYIMGLNQEFQEAVAAVARLDFASYAKDEMPLFEVVIRYLGGLLGAYDISDGKHEILLTKAVELGDYLLAAFDTPNHMPIVKWDHQSRKKIRATNPTNLAETGSLLVEFTRLAQLTKEVRFYDVVARVADALRDVQEDTNMPGMWSLDLDISGCNHSAKISATEKLSKADGIGDDHTGRKASIEDRKPVDPDDVSMRSKVAAKKIDEVDGTDKGDEPAGDDTLTDTKEFDGAKKATSKNGELDDLMSSIERKAKERVSRSDIGDSTNQDGSTERGETSLKKRQLDLADDADARTSSATSTTKDDACVKQDPIVELTNRNGVFVYSLGSRADSTYEYLPKQYVLLGGLEKSFETMYTRAIDVASGALLYKPMTPGGEDILFSGKLGIEAGPMNKHHFLADATHLGCFAGGMYAYGAKLFDRPEDLTIAKKLTQGCVWAYSITPSGLMPEEMVLSSCDNAKTCVWDEEKMERDKEYDHSRKVFSSPLGGSYPGKMQAAKPIARERKTEKILKEPATDAEVESDKELVRPSKPKEKSASGTDSDELDHEPRDSKSTDENDARDGEKLNESLPSADPARNGLKKRQLEDLEEDEAPKAKSHKKSYEEAEFFNSQGEMSGTHSGKVASDDDTKAVVEDDDMSGGLKAKLAGSAQVADADSQSGKSGKTSDRSDPSEQRADQQSEAADDKPAARGRKKTKPQALPEGVVSIRASDYKLRPEAIESVWYMYRITGDEHWRKVGWRMWQAVEKATSTKYGFSAINDVNSDQIVLSDKTESFWVAETLKYFYLLFADEDVVSLDDYVLNTEAHPFKRPAARPE